MSNITFYQDLTPIRHISQITDPHVYHDVPVDWWVALTDVKGSTKAIAEGRYKDVNATAAATITALLNSLPNIDIPFIFGGDGATMLIPPSIVPNARDALVAAQRLAKQVFKLDLRIGLVPIRDVLARGQKIRITKLFMSENFQQAIFTGGGMTEAERLLKNPETAHLYSIPDKGQPAEANFEGFECRWSEIPGPRGETVSLLVQATGRDEETSRIYREVLEQIETIYGSSESRHPIDYHQMHVGRSPEAFRAEVGIRQGATGLWPRLRLFVYSNVGYLLWKYHSKIWDRYRQVVRSATDHEKFDDMLRMIISGTTEHRLALGEYLQKRQIAGELVYGLHVSDRVLMTCIVFDRFGRQVHFVDGADGGYTLAAKQMKGQLAILSTQEIPAVAVPPSAS